MFFYFFFIEIKVVKINLIDFKNGKNILFEYVFN